MPLACPPEPSPLLFRNIRTRSVVTASLSVLPAQGSQTPSRVVLRKHGAVKGVQYDRLGQLTISGCARRGERRLYQGLLPLLTFPGDHALDRPARARAGDLLVEEQVTRAERFPHHLLVDGGV